MQVCCHIFFSNQTFWHFWNPLLLSLKYRDFSRNLDWICVTVFQVWNCWRRRMRNFNGETMPHWNESRLLFRWQSCLYDYSRTSLYCYFRRRLQGYSWTRMQPCEWRWVQRRTHHSVRIHLSRFSANSIILSRLVVEYLVLSQ